MSIYKLFAYQDKTAEIADLQEAYKYMQLFEYSDKITKIGNLQDAYKQIDTAPDGQSLTSLKSKRAKLLTHYEMPHNNNRPGAGVKASAFFIAR